MWMFKAHDKPMSGGFESIEEMYSFVDTHNVKHFSVKWSDTGEESWDGR